MDDTDSLWDTRLEKAPRSELAIVPKWSELDLKIEFEASQATESKGEQDLCAQDVFLLMAELPAKPQPMQRKSTLWTKQEDLLLLKLADAF